MKWLNAISAFVLAAVPVQAQVVLSLEDCRDMALRNDVRIRNASLDVMSARSRKQEAAAERLPRVSVSSYGFMALDPLLEIGVKDIFGDGAFGDDVQSVVDYLGAEYGLPVRYSALESGFSASVTAVQPLYAGGRITAGGRLASLGIRASLMKESLALREVLESVDDEYWKIVSLNEKMNTLEASEAFLANLSKDAAVSVEAGLALDTDLMQVELKRNELRRMRLSLAGGIRLTKMALFDAIGQNYSLVKTVSDTVKPYIDDIILSEDLSDLKPPEEYHLPEEDMLEGLSEAKLLDMSVEEKKLQKKMALGDALPQIGIGAAYGYSRLFNSRSNGIVFGMLKIPLSDWGKVSHRLRRLDYEMQKTSNDREYLKGRLLLQIRSLWLDLNIAWEDVLLAQEGVSLARKSADMMLEQYEAGLVTFSDLLESRARLRSAADALTDAEADYASALTAYQLRRP